jgi:S-DNA-T family DNA segregation ATPase FtsK/SpoIIIE
LLLYVFGASAWWWVFAGVVLVVAGYRHLSGREVEGSHPWLAVPGFFLLLLSSSALEALRLYRLPISLPTSAGGALGEWIGRSFATALGFNGATLVLIALFAIGWSLFTGMSWLRLMERVGAGIETAIAGARRRGRRRDRLGQSNRRANNTSKREKRSRREHLVVLPPVERLARNAWSRKTKPLFRMPDSPPPAAGVAPDAPRRRQVAAKRSGHIALIERKLAVSACRQVPRHAGRYHALRDRACGRREGAQIVNLMKDLARALSVVSIRVVETIPGKSCMGLELPTPRRQVVRLVELLSSATYNDTASPLSLALGKDIAGKPAIVDLGRMPHLLVAGTTGSGKSVAVNAMILSLLYKAEPRQVRLILIDPKMLELSVRGIPHLLAPVVTDMLAANALNWGVGEMEHRYRLMSTLDGATCRITPASSRPSVPAIPSPIRFRLRPKRRSRSRKCP